MKYAIVVLVLLLLVGCSETTPTPTATPQPEPTQAPDPTAAPPTASLTDSATATPAATPQPAATSVPAANSNCLTDGQHGGGPDLYKRGLSAWRVSRRYARTSWPNWDWSPWRSMTRSPPIHGSSAAGRTSSE